MSKGLEATKELKLDLIHRQDGELDPNQIEEFEIIKKELKALEIIKKAFNSSSTYTYKLKDSLECGWITQEEYDLLKEVLL